VPQGGGAGDDGGGVHAVSLGLTSVAGSVFWAS
jgi:hypothetical protein